MPKAQWPVLIGYISNKNVFNKEMVSIGLTHEFTDYAQVLHVRGDEVGNRVYICVNREAVNKRTLNEALATYVHEAVHAKQIIQKVIKEGAFADETEAYTVDWITNWLFDEYDKE